MECSLHKLETSIACSICNIPLCEECKKIEHEKIQCSRCYIRGSIKVKPKKKDEVSGKKEEKGRSYKTRTLPEVDPERIKLMIKNTQVKQLQEEENRRPAEELKTETVKKFCNWHDKRIAEYTCTKCQKTFCRDCLGEKKPKECYCKSCWSSIKYSHLFNKKR
ncbi:MAG: hypothetical protein ABRQ39_23700 [Candidatus Eremiobacterota bacterium]